MDLDLNLDNYDLEDILNLFNLPFNFNENHLKQAKKQVLKTHPDKSKLDKDIFLFFSKAYKILFYIYNFRRVNDTCISDTHKKYDKNDYYSKEEEKLIENFKKSKDFNKLFNKLFEENKLTSSYQETGYGDWLKEDVEPTNKITSLSQMNDAFYKEKKQKKEIIVYNGIEEMYSRTHNCAGLTGEQPDSYSSDMFSKFQYEDLKKAHNENIIPILPEDVKREYKSIEELNNLRKSQPLEAMKNKDLNHYLQNKIKNEEIDSTKRAYLLAREIEQSNQIKKNVMSNFSYLTNH